MNEQETQESQDAEQLVGHTPSPIAKEDEKEEDKSYMDPSPPKRPLSAFFWFCKDERQKVRWLP